MYHFYVLDSSIQHQNINNDILHPVAIFVIIGNIDQDCDSPPDSFYIICKRRI